MTEREYHEDLQAKGYAPAVEKRWEAGRFNDEHTHEQDLYVLILEGRFELGVDGRTEALGPGQTCEVPGGRLHSERAGPEGVRFLVATR